MIFLSYGHDSNAPLIEKIKEYLSKDAEGNLKHEVWIDTSETGTLSHEQCVVSHTLSGMQAGELQIRLKEYRPMTDSKIKRIGYLDPFEKFFETIRKQKLLIYIFITILKIKQYELVK